MTLNQNFCPYQLMLVDMQFLFYVQTETEKIISQLIPLVRNQNKLYPVVKLK